MRRPLGRLQRELLGILRGNGGRPKCWFRGCGWVWGTPGQTERILDSLVARGLVRARFEVHRPKSGLLTGSPVSFRDREFEAYTYRAEVEGARER